MELDSKNDRSNDRNCCGGSLRTWAMTSSLVSAVFLLISSMLAFWAYSWVKSQAEVFEAESSSFDSTLANAKMVSLGLGLLFIAAAVGSGVLYAVAGWSSQKPRRLRIAVLAVFFIVFLLVAWEIGGAIMCWSSAMEGVKAACASIDTECLSNYKKLMYYSIPVEVFGALVAAWMLISCRLYYIQEQKIISSSSSDTLPDDARPLFDKPGRTSSSLATLPYDDEVSRPSSRSSKKGSRGEAYSMSKRRSDSHRSSRASSRSRSRRRDQERERKRDREPRGEYSTRKSSHRSSSKSRRSSQSRAERAYESDSSSESDWDDRGERRRGSGSRRTRRR